MKTVIVTPQIPIAENGGIGTFVWYFSQLLRKANDDVNIILTHRPQTPRKLWMRPFKELGIDVTCVEESSRPLHLPNGYDWHQGVSEKVAELIAEGTDIVYFADWEANGFHVTQSRRFHSSRSPVVVTILHGSSAWHREGMQQWPGSYEDLTIDFRERYTAEHSDFVAAPSNYMIEWARKNGWALPPDNHVRALKLPYIPQTLSVDRTTEPVTQTAKAFERVIFFGGHLDTRKGIDLFVYALEKLADRPCMKPVKEVALLGPGGPNEFGTPEQIAEHLRKELSGVKVEALTKLTTFEAQTYLRKHASNSLVVMPSRAESMGYTVIETSLIPDVRMLCSNAGGIPEALGPDGQEQMFKPFLKPLLNKMEQWLLAGPQALPPCVMYDWEGANRAWIGFHQEVSQYACRARQSQELQQNQREATIDLVSADDAPGQRSLDVCIPYYNLGAYLPYLLDSLAHQTTQDFNVFVVNDGSTDSKSIAVFEAMKQKYQARQNWVFVSSKNQGVCEARNLAASLGNAEYICFADSDNIAAPTMVERFLDGIRQSGDDCLTCYMYIFQGERSAHKPSGLPHPANFHYIPYGNFPVLGILHNPFGDVNCIMRRSAFEAVGGFTTDFPHEINHEDRELLTRLSLTGHKLDVIPEFLLFYRERDDSRLRTTDTYLNDTRVVRHYQERLRSVGLAELTPLVIGLHHRVRAGYGIPASDDLWTLVYHVRGYSLLRALRVKVRNQIARRFGVPPKP
jgi:glycosyltransferase involved in cell wall biosynthesis